MPIFDKDKSRVKLAALRSGKHKPIYWYSILKNDKKPLDKICDKMVESFSKYLKENPSIPPTINKIYFYEWGVKIGEVTIN